MNINLYERMAAEQRSQKIFEQAKEYACAYMNVVEEMDVYPSDKAIADLGTFDEPLPEHVNNAEDVLAMLHEYGSKATVAQTGGRYFGFVNGGVVPVAMASRWLADAWDQNAALHVMSPLALTLEEVCERWLAELFGLPAGTAAGFVTGSSMATICALAAARDTLLERKGWDTRRQGLFNAPPIRVVVGEQAHSSVFKALSLLGLGKERVETVPVDGQGRILPQKMPSLDDTTLVIAQAGNVNGGGFDPLEEICAAANHAQSWVHVDGAFGLWAAASSKTRHLVEGLESADSWSVDTHKTLNAPYDCGVVLCKDRNALVGTMQASGSYIQYSSQRDGMLYTPDMSRRARSIELWATLKYLGRQGVGELVDNLCTLTARFAQELSRRGLHVVNEVVFNQILVRCASPEKTEKLLSRIQKSGKCWCGGATWQGEPVIRISLCSWRTTEQDILECAGLFAKYYAELS